MVASTSRFTSWLCCAPTAILLGTKWKGRPSYPRGGVELLGGGDERNAARARLALSYSLILAKISRPDASSYDVTFVDLNFSDLAPWGRYPKQRPLAHEPFR